MVHLTITVIIVFGEMTKISYQMFEVAPFGTCHKV